LNEKRAENQIASSLKQLAFKSLKLLKTENKIEYANSLVTPKHVRRTLHVGVWINV